MESFEEIKKVGQSGLAFGAECKIVYRRSRMLAGVKTGLFYLFFFAK